MSGRSAGLAAALGVGISTLVHTAAAALGLSAILSTSALAFSLVKYAGAAYLIYLGIRAFGEGAPSPGGSSSPHQGPWRTLGRAALTNLANPKVALFFLAFLPQFVRPERGHVVLQLGVLGLIVAVVGWLYGSIVALGAGALTEWMARNATFARWQQRLTGSLMVGLGVRLALAGRP